MLNSSEMDCFLAGLSEDWSEFYPKDALVAYINPQLDIGSTIEEVHTTLEGFFVQLRANCDKPPKDPKPYSGVIKMRPTVVYNRWTQEELDKYALSKTASVQLKLDAAWIATHFSGLPSEMESSPDW